MEWFGCMPGRGDRMEPSDRHVERQSWDEAFRRLYAPLVYRLGVIFGNTHIAEEAVQEAFYRSLCRRRRFEEISSLEAWLFVVARNVARDIVRHASRTRQVSDSEIAFENAVRSGLHVEEAVEDRVIANDLAGAIMRLSPAHREVLLLHYYDGYTIDEIAKRTGSRAGTIKSRLFRARQALREFIEAGACQQGQHHAMGRERDEPGGTSPRLARP